MPKARQVRAFFIGIASRPTIGVAFRFIGVAFRFIGVAFRFIGVAFRFTSASPRHIRFFRVPACSLPSFYLIFTKESFFIGVNPPEGREEGELDRSPLGTCRAMFITRQDAERGRSSRVKGSLRRERTLAPFTPCRRGKSPNGMFEASFFG